jgi:hypothetical protein
VTALKDELQTVGDAVDALTKPVRVREPYMAWHGNNRKLKVYEHTLPSLLTQLRKAAIPGEAFVEESPGQIRRAPRSCPPARLDAINLGLAITAWAADTVWRARRPVREDTADNLRAVVGAFPHDSDVLAALLRWVGQARVVAGWERAPWVPAATCPLCGKLGSLRVRLTQKEASCVECRENWDESTIGLLAQHVAVKAPRRDTSELRAAAVAARRVLEGRRAALAGVGRPDLPYVGA